jgi:hypothetical protein
MYHISMLEIPISLYGAEGCNINLSRENNTRIVIFVQTISSFTFSLGADLVFSTSVGTSATELFFFVPVPFAS